MIQRKEVVPKIEMYVYSFGLKLKEKRNMADFSKYSEV